MSDLFCRQICCLLDEGIFHTKSNQVLCYYLHCFHFTFLHSNGFPYSNPIVLPSSSPMVLPSSIPMDFPSSNPILYFFCEICCVTLSIICSTFSFTALSLMYVLCNWLYISIVADRIISFVLSSMTPSWRYLSEILVIHDTSLTISSRIRLNDSESIVFLFTVFSNYFLYLTSIRGRIRYRFISLRSRDVCWYNRKTGIV